MALLDLTPPSRRSILGAALASGLLPTALFGAQASSLVAGTYAAEKGAGLVPLTGGRDGWTAGAPVGAIRNASYGVRSSRHGLRYLLDEQNEGSVGVYDASFRQLATRPTQGAGPCYAALSPDQSALAIANYSSGTVAVWPLDPASGLPTGEVQSAQHVGSGPNSNRQQGPHAHWVGFTADGRLLHSVDLGADAIFAHPWNGRTRKMGEAVVAYHAVAGSGPRHLARHPSRPMAYLVAELANSVTVLSARPDGTFEARGMLSTLPAGFGGASQAAHIALNRAGTRLYVSNRGHDSIAVFAVGADGMLSLVEHVATGGHWPRLFLLLEDQALMLVANERSGTVTGFAVQPDGRLRATGHDVAVPGVAFLAV